MSATRSAQTTQRAGVVGSSVSRCNFRTWILSDFQFAFAVDSVSIGFGRGEKKQAAKEAAAKDAAENWPHLD